MLTATDNLLDDIGLHTPDTEDIFRSLFYTDNEYSYVRRDGAGATVTHSNELTQNVFGLAELDCAKRFGGYLFGWSYRGPYQYGIRIPRSSQTVSMTLLDVDDPSVVSALLATPLKDHAIWCPSNSPGRWHIHVIHDETDFGTCEETVYAWREQNGFTSEQIQSNVAGPGKLTSLTLPGQVEESLPCLPGNPDEPICSSYAETKQLFADRHRSNRVRLEDVFAVKPRPRKSYELEQPPQPVPTSTKKKYVRSDIPGLAISIGCTVNEQRHDYCSVQDCTNEGNGFLVSCAYISALVRKHQADRYLVTEEAMKHRQLLRTVNSKKHHAPIRLTHVKSITNYFCDHYDETKCRKHDPQQELEDRTALLDFFLHSKRSLVSHAQRKLKTQRQDVIDRYGKDVYRDAVLTIPFVIRDISRFNGRIASFSDKKREEYMFSDSACFMDYPTIQGSRRKRDRLVRIFRDYGIFTDRYEGRPTYDHIKRKCSRWNVCTDIIAKADRRIPPSQAKEKKEGRSESNKLIPSTNIVVHSPEPSTWHDPERDKYWQCWHDPGDLTESFAEKVARMRASMTPEV